MKPQVAGLASSDERSYCPPCTGEMMDPHLLLLAARLSIGFCIPVACALREAAAATMIESLKQFRKRHLSNDAVLLLFAFDCGKASAIQETAHRTVMKKDGGGHEAKNGKTEDGLPHAHARAAGSLEDESVLIKHPMEPNEIDHPIRCPRSESCVIKADRAATVCDGRRDTENAMEPPHGADERLSDFSCSKRSGGRILNISTVIQELREVLLNDSLMLKENSNHKKSSIIHLTDSTKSSLIILTSVEKLQA